MNASMRRRLVVGAAITAAAAAGIAPALAAARTSPSASFFHGGAGKAVWSHDTSNDPDGFSIALTEPDSSSYAGISLQHVAGPAPTTPPSFDFMSTVSGPSGGSPRLHINFSDGASADLRPLTWTEDTWTHEDGNSLDWDNNGGGIGCGYLYETSYASVLGCHAGATVTSAYIVTDSGWLYPDGYVNNIDNIQFGGSTISQPADNGNNS
jgi:hypothetical protein